MSQQDIRAAFLLALRLIEQRGPVFEPHPSGELYFATIDRFRIYESPRFLWA